MLSYQHEFHAGNHADVFKHSVLALALRALQRKDKPLRVLDIHAGSGSYDLRGPEAKKAGEHENGIVRVLAAGNPPAELAPYLASIRAANGGGAVLPTGPLRRYPGSPAIAHSLLRPADHLELMELHPRSLERLRRQFGREPRVHIHERDAFEGLAALLPPPERRGLVLVDPAYEIKEDFTRVAELLKICHKRFAGGVYLLWYPLIRHPLAERFPAKIRSTGIPDILQAELQVEAPGFAGMRGSGLCIVNPPYGLETELNRLLPWLWQVLKNDDRSGWRTAWLTEAR